MSEVTLTLKVKSMMAHTSLSGPPGAQETVQSTLVEFQHPEAIGPASTFSWAFSTQEAAMFSVHDLVDVTFATHVE